MHRAEMKGCGSCERPAVLVRENADEGRHGITGRWAVIAAVVVACVVQSLLLASVCSYVRHELMTIRSQVRQVMRDCHCRHPIISDVTLSRAFSPLQV